MAEDVHHIGRTQDRRSALLIAVRERGTVPVSDLMSMFDVSGETLRRDLRYLEEHKSIARSYGSVQALESGLFETSLALREQNQPDEKLRIVNEAVRHIGEARTLFLDEGFIFSMLAAAIPPNLRLTIVTSSLPVAMHLAERPGTEVIILGGRVRGNTMGVVGKWATEMLDPLMIDLAFVGANGVTGDGWLTTPDPTVAAVKAAALKSAGRRIFIGAHYKFGVSTFMRFANVTDFELLVTGRELQGNLARSITNLGVPLVRA